MRLAVECDGEIYHLDEHGQLRIEDLERQAILERAGWSVLRIPYRSWHARPVDEVERVLNRFRGLSELLFDDEGEPDEAGERRIEGPGAALSIVAPNEARRIKARVSAEGAAIMEAISGGNQTEEDVFRAARIALGYKRLGPRIRQSLDLASRQLAKSGLITVEEGEFFLTTEGRNSEIRAGARTYQPSHSNYGRHSCGSRKYRRRR